MSTDGDRRPGLRVLVSAYACHPTEGSEPAIGWAFLQAALSCAAEVHVLTRTNNVAAIEDALTPEQLTRCRLIPFDLSPAAQRWKHWAGGALQAYYIAWQVRARTLVRQLHAAHGYDLAHHVTFANDWTPVAVKGVGGLPFVWGPIGGRTRTPVSLLRYLGPRGLVSDGLRAALGQVGRATSGNSTAAAAAIVIAANGDVRRGYERRARQITIEPSVGLDISGSWPTVGDRSGPVLGIGRLLPWKGWALALEAVACIDDPTLRFVLLGEGPDRRRLAARARRLGIEDLIDLRGNVPREEITFLLRSARALLFPSFHDSSPWAVAEALAVGCPVVSLDLGGVPDLVHRAGGTIVPHTGPDLPARLAAAVPSSRPPHDPTVWSNARLPAIVRTWYSVAVDQKVAS